MIVLLRLFSKKIFSTPTETIFNYNIKIYFDNNILKLHLYAIISGIQHDDIFLPKISSHIISIRWNCVTRISLTIFSIILTD